MACPPLDDRLLWPGRGGRGRVGQPEGRAVGDQVEEGVLHADGVLLVVVNFHLVDGASNDPRHVHKTLLSVLRAFSFAPMCGIVSIAPHPPAARRSRNRPAAAFLDLAILGKPPFTVYLLVDDAGDGVGELAGLDPVQDHRAHGHLALVGLAPALAVDAGGQEPHVAV